MCLITSSCMISHTKLRSAIDGSEFPSRNWPDPCSQKSSNIDKDFGSIFLASSTALGFEGNPYKGASIVLYTSPATRIKSF